MEPINDPLMWVDQMRQLREHCEELERLAVKTAHQAGVSWVDIGKLYGISRQAAYQRFETKFRSRAAVTQIRQEMARTRNSKGA